MTFQAYLDNIHRRRARRPTTSSRSRRRRACIGPGITASRLIAWLKHDFDLGHGHAMAIWAVFKTNGWSARIRRRRPDAQASKANDARRDHPIRGARRTAAWAARVACRGARRSSSILVALHAIKPELDPSWRFMSEYAIGRQRLDHDARLPDLGENLRRAGAGTETRGSNYARPRRGCVLVDRGRRAGACGRVCARSRYREAR